MTTTITRTLAQERDRLDARLDELADQLADADEDSSVADRMLAEAREVDSAGQAVAALIAEHGEDAAVDVKRITAGDYARVEDRVSQMAAQVQGSGGVPGSSRNVYAAAGLADAPFLNGLSPDDLDGKIQAVANQSPGVAKWLENLINSVGESDTKNWTSLAERLGEKA